jgi:hypothetical protein
MERLLYFLPAKPQPALVCYATTTVVMAFCIAVQIGLENQTGFSGLFFLLPGIFAAGLMFDRGHLCTQPRLAPRSSMSL